MDDKEKRRRKEWLAAQSLSFTAHLRLIPACLRLRHLLAAVDRHPSLYSDIHPAVSSAIQRYENCWLPLLAHHSGHTAISPPLDCAWIWYCHRLHPLAYAKDCERIYGRTLGVAPSSDASDDDDAEAIRHTQTLWQARFPNEPFQLDLSRPDDLVAAHESDARQSNIQYDLRSAVKRQRSFYYQISEPHMGDERFLRVAEQRYKAFLHLFKMTESKDFLVPTYDIDLMWHAHMLHPEAYAHDTKTILEQQRVLDHDDTDSDRGPGKKLGDGFRQTSELWFESYGRAYQRAGTMYRGEPPERPHIQPRSSDVVEDNEGTDLDCKSVTKRKLMKVCISVVGARNIASDHHGALLVRLYLHSKCSSFKLETPAVDIEPSSSQTVWWKQSITEPWRFQAEKSTQGIWLELIFEPSNPFSREIILGRLQLPWKSVVESSTMSSDGWFMIEQQQHPKKKKTATAAPPYLFVSVSVTPPVLAPQLFRTIKSMPTDDSGTIFRNYNWFGKKKWLSRTVLDHANREVFIVRIRPDPTAETAEKRIKIHRGGWVYLGSSKAGFTPADNIVASAGQIVDDDSRREQASEPLQERRWEMQIGVGNGSHELIVQREQGSLTPTKIELRGSLADKVSLFPGRKLEYEVKGANAEDEAEFVTVVRHLPSGSGANATALFNWRTGAFEVSPHGLESVALVLLLSSIISVSVVEMQGLKLNSKMKLKLDLETKIEILESVNEWWGTSAFGCGCGGGGGGGGGCGCGGGGGGCGSS